MRTFPVDARLLWLVALLPAATACSDALPPLDRSAAATAIARTPAPASAARADGDSRAARDFHTFALNALLVPLLDPEPEQASPARWADPAFTMACLDAAVTVDGKPPQIDAPVPDRFTVRWRLDACTPLGPHIELSGRVTLQVALDGGGYVARVVPEALTIRSTDGIDRVAAPFTARLPLQLDVRSLGTASVGRETPGS